MIIKYFSVRKDDCAGEEKDFLSGLAREINILRFLDAH